MYFMLMPEKLKEEKIMMVILIHRFIFHIIRPFMYS